MTPLSTLIADQIQALNELGDELQDWYDNSPEGLQGSDKMQTVLEAASTISYLEEPEVPEWMAELEFPEPHCQMRVKTKADRLQYHCALLTTIAEIVGSHLHLPSDDPDQDDVDELIETLNREAGDLEGLLS